MAELTSNEQNQRIFMEMRDGAILAEIDGHPLSEIIGAIRSLTDDQRGRLIDDWLIAVVSKYSSEAYRIPTHLNTCKLIMENCTQLAKSFGEESSSKKKTGTKSIYIRAVKTRASQIVGESPTAQTPLGPKVIGGRVPSSQERINEEVARRIGPKTTEAQREPFIEMLSDEEIDDEPVPVIVSVTPIELEVRVAALPVMAQRLLEDVLRDRLDYIPGYVADYDLTELLELVPQIGEIEMPTNEGDAAPYETPTGEEHWASTRKNNKPSVTPHADSVNIPLAATGVTVHKGVSVDSSELKAIRASRNEGFVMGEQVESPELVAPIPPPLVSIKPLPKAFSKPLPDERPRKEPKPILPPLTKEERATIRLEKRRIALELYKQKRGG